MLIFTRHGERIEWNQHKLKCCNKEKNKLVLRQHNTWMRNLPRGSQIQEQCAIKRNKPMHKRVQHLIGSLRKISLLIIYTSQAVGCFPQEDHDPTFTGLNLAKPRNIVMITIYGQ